jgi:hypothetical protein
VASRRSPFNPHNRLSKNGGDLSAASPLSKQNGPYGKIPAEIRISLLAAFYQERPKPEELVSWCRAKAEEWDIAPEGLSTLVGNLTLFLEREVQLLLGNEAEKFAAAAGLTLTRTLERLNQLIDCEKPQVMRQGSDQPDKLVYVPDNQARNTAVSTALTYFGRLEQRHSVKHDHDHTHRHVIMNLSDEEVLNQIKNLHQKTQAMLEDAQKNADTSTIDISPIPDKIN